MVVFQVSDAEPRIITRGTPPYDEGGLGSPSAAEIAAALSDPNTNLGSVNMLFDYVAYDGDFGNTL